MAPKPPTMESLAARIEALLKAIAADPAKNEICCEGYMPRALHNPYAWVTGNHRRIFVRYRDFGEGDTVGKLSREWAIAWLEAGNIGRFNPRKLGLTSHPNYALE